MGKRLGLYSQLSREEPHLVIELHRVEALDPVDLGPQDVVVKTKRNEQGDTDPQQLHLLTG